MSCKTQSVRSKMCFFVFQTLTPLTFAQTEDKSNVTMTSAAQQQKIQGRVLASCNFVAQDQIW